VAELTWELEAVRDLDQIAEYIARQSPDYAPIYVARVVAAIERLEELPFSGRVIPELDDDALREVIFQNYRIAYEVSGDQVVVLGVIHSAIDFGGVARERGWFLG
jgi:plasmid stabilization system protein ParE